MSNTGIEWLILLMTVSLPHFGAHVDDIELDYLQGDWQAIELVIDGVVIPMNKLTDCRISIWGHRLTYQFMMNNKLVDVHFLMAIDASSRPRKLDAELLNGAFKGQVCRGIYEPDADRLKICLPSDPQNSRPVAFRSMNGSSHLMFSLQRTSFASTQ